MHEPLKVEEEVGEINQINTNVKRIQLVVIAGFEGRGKSP